MDKLKSLLVKIKSTLTLRTYRKPLPVTIFRFLVLNVIVVFGAVFLVRVIDPTYVDGDLVRLLTHFASCMVTPNTFVKLVDIVGEHPWVVLISLIVIVLELVLFSGAVIATLSAALRTYINNKGEAKGKIYMHDHFVILNWNSEVPDLLYNLMMKNYRRTVIILSNKTKEEVSGEVESIWAALNKTNRKHRKLKLIVKRGDPLLETDLMDISIEEANHILIMAKDGPNDSNDLRISGKDLLSLKIVLALGNFKLKPDCNIVIETESEETKKKLQRIFGNLGLRSEENVTAISLNNKIGQILAQSLLEPRLADMYAEFLSFKGHEFYPYHADSVEEYLSTHDNGIPVCGKDGTVIVFAKDQRQLRGKRLRKIDWEDVRPLPTHAPSLAIDADLYVIGESKKIGTVQRNLRLAKRGYSNFQDEFYAKHETDRITASIRKSDPRRPKRMLLLTDDNNAAGSDADIFVNLITIRTQLSEIPNLDITYAVEIMDAKNETAVKNLKVDTVIKSRYMMALLLSRIALNREARKFYDNLLEVDSEEGGDYFDIKMEEADKLLDFDALGDAGELQEDGTLVFERPAELITRFYKSLADKYMLLGYIHEGQTIYLPTRQDRRHRIALGREDSLIFIKY